MTVTTKGESPFSDILPVTTNDLNITQLEQLKEALGINIINDNIGGIQDDVSNNKVRSVSKYFSFLKYGNQNTFDVTSDVL